MAKKLILNLKEKFKNHKFLLSFISPSGYENSEKDFFDCVIYLPIASKKNCIRFYNIINPKATFFIKNEVWPNFIKYAKLNGSMLYSIGGNFKNSFLKRFFKINSSIKQFDKIYTLNDESKKVIENIGNKNNPKYRTTTLWFDLVVTETGGQVLKENYKKVCEEVIEYINLTFNKKYNPSTYYDRFKIILNKTFNGENITGETMVEVFNFCKNTWSEQYQSSVTPETIFGNKFMTKYLLQYNEWSLNNNTYIKERKNVAII